MTTTPTRPGRARARPRGVTAVIVAIAIAALLAAGWRLAGGANVIRIGAVFPLTSNAADLVRPELAGVQIAVDLVNADGGIAGRRVELEIRDLRSRSEADRVMADLRASGAQIVIGAYSSELSIAASEAADRAGLLYWEAGAVADRLTGRGLPMVFRVGASGANLGANSAAFAATELASRLGKAVGDLRIALAVADDEYAGSVADAAEATARAHGLPVVIRRSYSLALPDWPAVMADLAGARPDVIILASHIPDGIAFRQAMLEADLRVGALIGSTMAECDPDFAGELGADAIGIFASDRPTAGFRPAALRPEAAEAYARFAAAWADVAAETGGDGDAAEPGDGYDRYGDSEYTIHGPAEDATAEESEEALSGFTATWALLRHVLPGASEAGAPDAAAVAAAARTLDLPDGSLPNGAGLRFSADPATLGQNTRAAAVMWQWTAERTYSFVWPPTYATADVAFVPLDR
jgi:ABC-type branched-subunit amino acid transport system substrate-binding protein